MNPNRISRGLAVLSVPVAVTLSLLGCSSQSSQGCTKDSDCKGDRVCASGQCVDLPTKVPSNEPGGGNAHINQDPNPGQTPPVPQANPGAAAGAYANDGLPAEIPAPGSSPPSVAEWAAVPREVTVRGSTALNCETKMLREWLRASCHPSAAKGNPFMIDMEPATGQQAFKFVGNGVASVVVQVIRGREFSASYIWDNGGAHQGATLHVNWPSDHPRPVMFFEADQ
jgi:hypothetical protein